MKVSTSFEYPFYQYNRYNQAHLMVSITGGALNIAARKKLGVVAVVDVSGSMQDLGKIDYAKKSICKLIEHLGPGDTFALVTFESNVKLVIPPVVIGTTSKDKLISQVAALRASGGTNLHSALQVSKNLAKTIDSQVRVVVFTDGEPSVGIVDHGLIIQEAAAEDNVSISSFGYGAGHDSKLLTSMADKGQGNYAYVKNPDDALTAFAKELGGLMSCVAQKIKIKFSPKSEARVERVLNDLKVEDNGENVTVHMNDLFAEETKHLLLKLNLPARDNYLPRPVSVGSFTITWEDALTGKLQETLMPVKVKLEKTTSTQVNQEVADQVAIFSLYEANIKAMRAAEIGDFGTAKGILRGVDLSNVGASVSAYAMNINACYLSDSTFNDSKLGLSATNYATKSGRSIGSSMVNCSSNSLQASFTSSFNESPGKMGLDQVVTALGQTGVEVPVETLANVYLGGSQGGVFQTTTVAPILEEKKVKKSKKGGKK